MTQVLVLAAFVSCATVIQGGLNARIAPQVGLTGMVFGNALFLFLIAFVLWLVALWRPELLPRPLQFPGDKHITSLSLVTSVMGLVIVLGIPMMFARGGALQTFVLLVAFQLIASQVWDLVVLKQAVNPWKILGTVIAFLGVWISTKKS